MKYERSIYLTIAGPGDSAKMRKKVLPLNYL